MDDLTIILDLLGNFGFSAVFLWLFIREANKHDGCKQAHMRDLREIAGMRLEDRLLEDGSSPRPVDVSARLNGDSR